MAFCTYSQEGLLITSGSDSCPAMSLKTRTKFTYGKFYFKIHSGIEKGC